MGETERMSAEDLGRTRRALHGVAELVLAGPQFRASGTIRLRLTPQGIATVATPELYLDGTHLVSGDRGVAVNGRSCAALAGAVGVEAGAPADLYHDGSGVAPDEPLALDAD